MPKRDYYDDPEAPAANSIVAAVTALVRNDQGQVLLIQRGDNGLWALPGGAQDIGEAVHDAVIREVREETAELSEAGEETIRALVKKAVS